MTPIENTQEIKEHKFILGEKSYTVKDEHELALILDILKGDDDISSILHWNIIMELDEDLMIIIKSYKGLTNCIKSLNEKNTFLLLVKISDNLSNIFRNSHELGEILAKLSEEGNKIRLLRQMRNRGLSRLIVKSEDLLNILEWVYESAEREALDILGPETIRELFVYPQDIYNVLHYLDDINKDYLIDLIGMYEISKKVKVWEDFLLILKGISYDKVKQFLALYNVRQVKDLFKNDQEFRQFLMRLSDRKQTIFLEFLGINDEKYEC